MAYVDLHVHSEYSLCDSIAKVKKIVEKSKTLGRTACAITDHGVGYALVEFHDACKEAGIKPILGVEAYEAHKSRFDKKEDGERNYYHLILLVKNDIGYKNLCKLISRSNTEGFYYKPRIDFELLERYHDGLVCLSACIAGRVQQDIIKGDLSLAETDMLKYKELFGEDYYLEIQNHGIKEEALVAQELYKLSKKHGIKLVCTNDCHYINSEDTSAHEWMLCIQTEKTMSDPDRMVYHGDYSIKTEEDMRSLFPSIPEAFDNTIEVADKCNFEFTYGNYRMPKVIIPKEYSTDYFGYLYDLAYKGLEERYPEGHDERERAKANLEYELSVIKQMGFAEYFLDTRKTILWARDNDVLVGPGRGSAAGSTMCYCLKITDIDPIKYGLLFERFLNPDRISMPDIDVDYQYSRKDEVIKSEADSNGLDKFCKIQTFNEMLAKGVVRDCARVAGYEAAVGAKLSKLIPGELGMTLNKAYEHVPELREYIESDDKIKELWDTALKLENLKKSTSTHACGHIPTPVPCEELFPVSVDKVTGYLVCQYNMNDTEHLGNLKKDLLMLRNLTIIDETHRSVKKRFGVDIPLWNDAILNDTMALDLYKKGETNGVFQFESDGMKKFVKELQPDCYEDIIAAVSLYRPGPMDFIPDYIKGKKVPESIRYTTPKLESILAPTYGCIVYQEQVMKIVRDLAGFSMGRADLLRKAMGKKKMDVMEAERVNFVNGNEELGIDGCIKCGISANIANAIYDNMIDFAKYAFNKSHAACYAAIAMQTAYLKAHYLADFLAGLLSSVMDKTEKLIPYRMECKKRGIGIQLPNVNTSEINFTVVDDNTLSFGLCSIKNIGEDFFKAMIKERQENGPYTGMTDFVERTGAGKKVLEQLIKAGAFSFTGYNRRTMVTQVDNVVKSVKNNNKKMIEGQISMFEYMNIEETRDVFKECIEYEKKELLQYEKEAVGYYLSGHPLEEYAPFLEKLKYTSIDFAGNNSNDEKEAHTVEINQHVKVCGSIVDIRKIYTKKNEAMCFATIEDLYGQYKVTVFPKTYAEQKEVLKEDNVIVIDGTIDINEEYGLSVLANNIKPINEFMSALWIRIPTEAEYTLHQNFIDTYPEIESKDSIKLVVYITDSKKTIYTHRYMTTASDNLFVLKSKFGNENVVTTYK